MNKYMKIAINEAKKGIRSGHGGPFGAVVVKDGVVVGKGHNRVVLNNDPTCHGEISAIRDACKKLNSFDLKGADIYTTGEPCLMCFGAILWANINKIYYGCSIAENSVIGFRDEVFYKKLSLSTQRMRRKLKQIDHDECMKLFEEYMAITDKIKY